MGKKVLLCIWDNGFRERKPTRNKEHPTDATTGALRPHSNRLRRPPAGGNNAGLLLPATLAQHVGLRELVDRHLDLGDAPGRANTGDKMLTLVASALAGGDCIDDADALRAGRTSSVLGVHGQSALHLGDVPAQLPVGPCPPAGPGEPGVAGPGLAGWRRTRRRAADHRPGLHHLRDLRAGQGGGATTMATLASEAITRCWPWPPEPATC